MGRTEQIYALGTITTAVNIRGSQQVEMLVNGQTGWKMSLIRIMNGFSRSSYGANGNKAKATKYCF